VPADRLRNLPAETAVAGVGEAAHPLGELRLHSCAHANLVLTGSVILLLGRLVRIVGLSLRCDRHGERARPDAKPRLRHGRLRPGGDRPAGESLLLPPPRGADPEGRRQDLEHERHQPGGPPRARPAAARAGVDRPEIAAELGVSLSTVGNYLNGSGKATGDRLSASGPSVKGSGHGETPANGETVRGQSFEFRASALVELGRRVDQARAELEPAQAAYEEACRRWQQAVERLPAANGC
jgi:hypothetical protein